MPRTDPPGPPTLRDRKRARKRAAIVAAGTELFDRVGYDETTIGDIAAAADIGARTFFDYFASKDALLFPESDRRVEAAIAAIAARTPDDRPVDVLLRALTTEGPGNDELVSPIAALRLRLMDTVPAVRGRSFQMQRAAQREIAARLCEEYSDLDSAHASALVGAFIGAVGGVLDALLNDPTTRDGDPAELFARVRETVASALTNTKGQSELPAH